MLSSAAYRVDEFVGDLLQQFVAHLQYGGVVLTDGVVEGDLVLAQSELSAALVFVLKPLGQFDQFGYHSRGVQGVVLVAQ
jgi:hypothetical protein